MRELPVAARAVGLDLTREKKFETVRVEKLKIQSDQSVEETIDRLSRLPEVEYAEPDYIVHAAELLPNDTRFGELWALKNTGQAGGKPGADIEATFAWDIETGSSGIVVAVIDSGVNYSHPDLAANMWKNPAELNGTAGVDDDGNGFIDDIHGINAINGSGDPNDDEGHGTHVAGIVAAVGNNNQGVTGVAFNTQVMALKFLNSSGSGTISDAITCIDYAVDQGARIVNTSWGSGGFSFALQEAIRRAGDDNVLCVAAAGNDGRNVDQRSTSQHYPSGFNNANIISVGSSNRDEQISTFSNLGSVSVDLFAPGEEIVSTVLGSGYATSSGTSMAAPQVSGVAALLWADLGAGTPLAMVRQRILANVDKLSVYSGKCVTGGRLNAHYALDPSAAPTPPPTPSPTPSPTASPSPTPSPTTSPTPSPTPTPAPGSIALSAGWNLFSFPVDEVTEITVPSGAENTFWVWDSASQAHQQISATVAAVNSGQGTARGFWVFSQGTAALGFRGNPAVSRTVELTQGWNLIGLPRPDAVQTDQLTVRDLRNQTEGFLSDLGCDDLTAPSNGCLLFQYLFFWNGSYASLDASENASLQPRRAHWIYVWGPLRLDYFPLAIGGDLKP
jgi:subtilisin family serine protease